MSNAKQETIADIVADIRSQNQGLPEDSYALSPLVCDLLSFADRIEAAHQREVAELKRQRNEALAIASDIDKCASIERHTDAMLKKNEVIVGLRKEVAELRECLKETMADAVAEYKNNSCFRNVKCGEIERCDTCKVMKWRKVLKGASND